MALWTIVDLDIVREAEGGGTVRLQLSDDSSVVNREITIAEARALCRQIENLAKTNPEATMAHATIGDELFEIDLGSARSLLDRLPPDKSSTFSLTGRRIPAILAIAVMLALLAGWGATYFMLRRSIDAANVEMIKFAGRLVQAPRGSQALVDQAMEMLAKDASIPISAERRQQLVQVLAKYPETSIETLIELYGAEFPEFNLLAERLKAYGLAKGNEAADPADASSTGPVDETPKPQSASPPPQSSGKEITDRLPEEHDESSSGRKNGSAKTQNPATPEADKSSPSAR